MVFWIVRNTLSQTSLKLEVPEILKSGHHANIEKWRFLQRYQRTLERRPELIEQVTLTKQQKKWLSDEQG